MILVTPPVAAFKAFNAALAGLPAGQLVVVVYGVAIEEEYTPLLAAVASPLIPRASQGVQLLQDNSTSKAVKVNETVPGVCSAHSGVAGHIMTVVFAEPV